jgi:hypothetical protein
MRRTALILLCAALPASALAAPATNESAQAGGQAGVQKKKQTQIQGSDGAPVMRGNWSLKAPKKKRPGQGATQQAGQQSAQQNVEGPAVPSPMRQRVPKPKAKQQTVQRESNHVNATPMISQVLRKNQRGN